MARGRRRGRQPSEEVPEPEEVQEVEDEVEQQEEEEPEAVDEEEDAVPAAAVPDDAVRLQFDEELTWRPGKAIPVTTLLDRLQRLAQELQGLDQDQVDPSSLHDVAAALGQRNLLTHKNEGVRALTAACIADILRLSAPDAPFTSDQLKTFFALVISHVFPALGDASNPYHKEQKYVLRSLAEVQSILLVNEVDGADDLLLRLFSNFFDTVSGSGPDDGVSKDITILMGDIMSSLVDEASGISPKVIEVIMAQFLRAAPPGGPHAKQDRADRNGQSTLLLKSEPAAYIMAKDLCNQGTEKMVHYVSQYFSDVIIDASRFAAKSNGNHHHHADDGDDNEEGPRGPTEAELRELRKAHLLIKELWRAAPAVLQNVIPQVEAELSADNVDLRHIATETLGDMISGIGAAGPPPAPVLDPAAYPPLRLADDDVGPVSTSILTTPLSPQSFAQTHSAAYHSFIGRNKDKMPSIRAAWTTAVGNILSTSAGGIGLGRENQAELVRALNDKLNDSDERVRLAAIKAVELFGFRDFVLKLGPTGTINTEGSILSSLGDRCRDRRPAVRVEAVTLLANLWAAGAGELAAGQELVVNSLSGIPSVILKAMYINDLDLNMLIERAIFESLVPLTYPPLKSKSKTATAAADGDRIRAERILLLVRELDAQARKGFFALQQRQQQYADVFEMYLKQCEAYNGGVMDSNSQQKTTALEKTIDYIGKFFADPLKVKADYQKFAKANDRRNYQLIRFAVASDSDFKTVRGAIKELVKRMQATPNSSALETLVPFLYRSASLIFNKSHLPTILDYAKTDQDGFGSVAHEILHEISVRKPDLFKNFVGELCKDLVQQAPTETRENDATVVDILRATSSFAKKYPKDIPSTKEFVRALSGYALYGQPVKSAKYAVKVLLARGDREGLVVATALFTKVMKQFEYGAPFFLNKLQCTSQLYLQAPTVTQEADEEVLKVTVQDILREVRTEASNKDPDWVDDTNMDEELQAKCLSLRIAVNRLRSMEDVEEAKLQVAPIFKLLMNLITKDGEICKIKDTPAHHRSRLRLLAANLVLKLCTFKHFDDCFSHKDFNLLALIAQDREPNVRRGFLEKLMKYLASNKLKFRFFTLIFLAAFEPVADFKQSIDTWIRSRVNAMQGSEKMEALMGRLIPLLAHHPDYGSDLEDLADTARYLLFFISTVATEKNLGLLVKYAERVKQTRDALSPEQSENLYVLSDLAQAVIRQWQERKGWTFQAYPGKVGLPMGLFSPLPSHDVAQEIANKQYIPDGIEDKLDELLKATDKKKKRKTAEDRADGGSVAKKPRVAKEPRPKAAPKKKAPAAAKPKAKPKKTKPARSSSPPINDADRRRSGRSRKTATSAYTERDSSDDDREMLTGVAQWEYEKGSGDDDDDALSSAVSDPADSDAMEEDAPEEEEHEAEPSPPKSAKRKAPAAKAQPKPAEDDDDDSALSDPAPSGDEAEDEEEEAPPPKSNGRGGRKAATELPSRPAARGKKAAPAATTTRPRRGRAAAKKDEDMDVDSE
ncbi:Spo76 protein [Plectosphaerella cucumerina]|uniref:Spo76 protein n=1 Tax=Plectosphaerella cucumerina TaxID=40658 RepID=A0A8K0WYY1_9PEZI|nr:Spo76 protein [Plectosphaerella cucumerina]